MTLTVHLFARCRELARTDAIPVDLPPGGTVADLRRALAEQYPHLAGLLAVSAVAVNHDFAEAGQVVHSADELAVIPPVSGGSPPARGRGCLAVGCGVPALGLLWLFTAYGLHLWMSTPSNRVIRSWDQPETVNYPSGKRYVLYALEGSPNPEHGWLLRAFNEDRRLILVVVPRGTPPTGYWDQVELDPPFERGSRSLREYVSDCDVTWARDCVTLDGGTSRLTIDIEHVDGGP